MTGKIDKFGISTVKRITELSIRSDFHSIKIAGLNGGKWILMLHATDQGRQTDCSRAENSKYVDVCMNASLENIIMF